MIYIVCSYFWILYLSMLTCVCVLAVKVGVVANSQHSHPQGTITYVYCGKSCICDSSNEMVISGRDMKK